MKQKNAILIINISVFVLLAATTAYLLTDYLYLRTSFSDMRHSFNALSNPSLRPDGTSSIGSTFIDFTMNDLKGNIFSLSKNIALIKIIIIFNTDDCAGCLEEYRLWKKIYEAFHGDKVCILGICTDDNINSLISFVEERMIEFPILHDPRRVIKTAMGFRFSPLRIMLDRNNRIINIERSGVDIGKQKKLMLFLQDVLKESKE